MLFLQFYHKQAHPYLPPNTCSSPPDSKPCEPWIPGALLFIALHVTGQESLRGGKGGEQVRF